MKKKDVVRAMEDRRVSSAIANDPKINQWADELGIPSGSRREAIVRSPKQNYDTRTAILQGARPGLDSESGKLHWPDESPATGQPLKSRKHPTYRYTLQDLAPQPSASDQIRKLLGE